MADKAVSVSGWFLNIRPEDKLPTSDFVGRWDSSLGCDVYRRAEGGYSKRNNEKTPQAITPEAVLKALDELEEKEE